MADFGSIAAAAETEFRNTNDKNTRNRTDMHTPLKTLLERNDSRHMLSLAVNRQDITRRLNLSRKTHSHVLSVARRTNRLALEPESISKRRELV